MTSALASRPVGRADTILDFGLAGQLEVRAASVRGRSHRYAHNAITSRTRQDDYGFQLSHDGAWLVVFVADGVSAGEESHAAAAVASRRGCQLVVGAIDSGLDPATVRWSEDIAPRLAGYIMKEAQRHLKRSSAAPAGQLNTADAAAIMATTAVCLVVRTYATPDGGFPYYGAAIAGDCSIWILGDDRWTPLSPVKNADREIASNAVLGLPYLGDVSTYSGTLTAREALFVMSDGLGDPLGSGQGEVGTYLVESWRTPPGPYEFASTLDFYRRSFDDDRTAVGIWPAATSSV